MVRPLVVLRAIADDFQLCTLCIHVLYFENAHLSAA
jgi:hypothetical protein